MHYLVSLKGSSHVQKPTILPLHTLFSSVSPSVTLCSEIGILLSIEVEGTLVPTLSFGGMLRGDALEKRRADTAPKPPTMAQECGAAKTFLIGSYGCRRQGDKRLSLDPMSGFSPLPYDEPSSDRPFRSCHGVISQGTLRCRVTLHIKYSDRHWLI